MPIDTFNKFLVGVRRDSISFPLGLPATMSKDDALMLAAWIVALADTDDKFSKLLEAVRGT
jgi:hypothetical protein